MSPIPLEENLDWWWYKAKTNLLKFIIENKRQTIDRSFNKILEIGPGLGKNLKYLSSLGVVDILKTEPEFIKYIELNRENYINKIYNNIDKIEEKYDFIVMLDVLEHIENSQEFMLSVNQILKRSGEVILGVPAYSQLWSSHDEKLDHYRRYNWKKIYSDCNSFDIAERYGFNYLLLPIRYLQILLNKTSTTNEGGNLTNNILYSVSIFESTLRKIGINPKFGISLYAKLKKKKT